MSDIIEILESAGAGSREIDLDIAIICGDFKIVNTDKYENALFDRHEYCYGVEGQWKHYQDELPRYSTSIDDALTLVPEGWVYSLINDFGNLNRVRLFDGLNINIESDGDTMPLSICIAALAAIAYK